MVGRKSSWFCVKYFTKFGVFTTNRVGRIYLNIWIYLSWKFIQAFVRLKYIRIFVRIVFLIRIYSDIHSYHYFDTNIFVYSFISFLDTNIQEKNLRCAPTGPKDKWLKLFTRRLIFKEKLLPFCCVNYVFNFLLYHTSTSNIKNLIWMYLYKTSFSLSKTSNEAGRRVSGLKSTQIN